MRTVKHILNKVFFLCCSLLLLNTSVSHAAEIDSAWFHQLVDKAAVSLRNIILRNEELKAKGREKEMQFVVTVNDGEPVGPYFMDEGINGNKGALAEFGTQKDGLEVRLKNIYKKEKVEAYVLMLNCFDVKVNRLLTEELTVESLFSAKTSDDTNIPDLQVLHNNFTKAVMADKNMLRDGAARILLSTGVYRIGRRTSLGEAVSDRYYYFKSVPNPASKLATENIVPLLYRYLKENNPKDGSALGYADFQVSSLEKAIHSSKFKASILNTYTVPGMIEILNNFGSMVDYKGLSLEERIHIISVLLTEKMHGQYLVNDNAEGAVVKIFKTVPKEQIEGFFTKLEQPTALNSDNRDSKKYPLINRLLDEVDDVLLVGGGNNYTDMIAATIELLPQSPLFGARVKAMGNSAENLLRHTVYWKSEDDFLPGDRAYSVNLLENGHVQVGTKIVKDKRYRFEPNAPPIADIAFVPGSEEVSDFSPFELVVFRNLTNESFLSMATNADKGTFVAVPAVFLDYAVKKKISLGLQKAGFMVLDIAVLATGYGGIVAAASDIRKAIIIFNMATSALNLTANTFEEQLQGTKFHEVVEAANMLMLAVGVAEFAHGAPRTMASALRIGMKISKNVAKEVALHFIAAVMRVEVELADLRLTNKAVAELLDIKNEMVREYPEVYRSDLVNDLKELEANAKGEGPKHPEETHPEGSGNSESVDPYTPPIETENLHPDLVHIGIKGKIQRCVYEVDGVKHVAKRVYQPIEGPALHTGDIAVKEILFAEKIAEMIGEDLVRPYDKNYPAFDLMGRESGKPISLKEVKNDNPKISNIRTNAFAGYNRVWENNRWVGRQIRTIVQRRWEKVEVYIEAKSVPTNEAAVQKMWDKAKWKKEGFYNDGLVSKIVVFLDDNTHFELSIDGWLLENPKQ